MLFGKNDNRLVEKIAEVLNSNGNRSLPIVLFKMLWQVWLTPCSWILYLFLPTDVSVICVDLKVKRKQPFSQDCPFHSLPSAPIVLLPVTDTPLYGISHSKLLPWCRLNVPVPSILARHCSQRWDVAAVTHRGGVCMCTRCCSEIALACCKRDGDYLHLAATGMEMSLRFSVNSFSAN